MTDAPTDGPRRYMPVLLALLTSGLVILALPTFELTVIGLVAWAPLLYAVRPHSGPAPDESPSLTRRQRFGLGLLAGFVYQLVLFRWIPFTLSEMTPFPSALTWLMAILYALWHALQIALFAAWLPAATRLVATRFPSLLPVATALFFAFVEWLFPALFPWSFGHTAWEVGPVAAPLLSLQGVPLLTFWVLLPSALIADLFARPRLRRAATTSTLVTLVAVLALATGLRALMLGSTDERLRVAVIQPNYTLAEKKKASRATRTRLLDRLEAQLRALPPGELDLVVGSEGAFPLWWQLEAGPLPAQDPNAAEAKKTNNSDPLLAATRRVQRAIVDGSRAHTILGGLRIDEDGETRNAAVHLAPDGQIRGHYDKQTLVPFSEYVPLADLFPALKEIPGIGHMIPGVSPCRFDAELGRGPVAIGCGICYESMFAGDTRLDAGESRLLVNLTIDTWFGTSTAPRMHLMSHASRAAELGVPLIRAGLTGISAIIDPAGQVIASLPLDTPGVLRGEVTLTTGTTVYRAVGQLLMPLIGLALLLLVLRSGWRRLRAKRLPSTLTGPA